MNPHVLYQDEEIAVLYKPSGYHVHPHENPIHRVHRSQVLLYIARDLVRNYVYPVHRLDAGTSGVILFALTKEAARDLSGMFQTHAVHKTYEAVVRGWVAEKGSWTQPLELDSTNELAEAHTDYELLHQLELPFAVRPQHPTTRYSWVRVFPRTGKFHQIRRHFARGSHPLMGDAMHGDAKHNQFFRKQLGLGGLCLKASALELKLPWSGQNLRVQAPMCDKWRAIEQLFLNPLTVRPPGWENKPHEKLEEQIS